MIYLPESSSKEMTKPLFLILAILLSISCRKDDGVSNTLITCASEDKTAYVKLHEYRDFGGLEVFPNGMVALHTDHILRIYDRAMSEVVLSMPLIGYCRVLADNTFLVIETAVEQFDSSGYAGIGGYVDMGYDKNCEEMYLYQSDAYLLRTYYNVRTTIRRYDTKGKKLWETKLDGMPSRKSSHGVIQFHEELMVALYDKDSLVSRLSFKDGFYRDSVFTNYSDAELNLYGLDMSGEITWQKTIGGLQGSTPYGLHHRFEYAGGKFWYISESHLYMLNGSGALESSSLHLKDQCSEFIEEVIPMQDGIYIVSRNSSNEIERYTVGASFVATDQNFKWYGHPLGWRDDQLFFSEHDGISIEYPTNRTIYEANTSAYSLDPLTFRMGCDGHFYGIVRNLRSKFLVKITSTGKAPPITWVL